MDGCLSHYKERYMQYINKSKIQNKSNLQRERAGVSYHTILTISYVALRFEFLFHVMHTKKCFVYVKAALPQMCIEILQTFVPGNEALDYYLNHGSVILENIPSIQKQVIAESNIILLVFLYILGQNTTCYIENLVRRFWDLQ